MRNFNGCEITTAGDGFLAAFDGLARAIRRAGAIREAARSLGLEVRCGLHTVECELVGEDLAGIAVHIGALRHRTGRARRSARFPDRSRPGGWFRINVRRARRAHLERCAERMAPVSGNCGLTHDLGLGNATTGPSSASGHDR